MAKKRSAAPRAAASVDSVDASKKQKPEVHEGSVTVVWPNDTSPQIAKLDRGNESSRALREAEAAATEVLHITPRGAGSEAGRAASFELFAKPFGAAVASACAKWSRPVTLNEVITEIAETGCKVQIGKTLKQEFAWRGFSRGRWQISRRVHGQGLVAFPKGSLRDKDAKKWRFSPSPASRRPLANLSK